MAEKTLNDRLTDIAYCAAVSFVTDIIEEVPPLHHRKHFIRLIFNHSFEGYASSGCGWDIV